MKSMCAKLMVLAGVLFLSGCGKKAEDKDFSKLDTPQSQEEAYEYTTYFLPEKDGTLQGYVGDPMPYYEDGIYYMYYLKDGGDSFNHSIYLTTTKDFVKYEEQETPVLESAVGDEQDSWIGTGSVVKVDKTYYLFYTGHTSSENAEYKEKVMVAKSDDLKSFEKVKDWYITPTDELGQKNDFRDPQAYYDSESGQIMLTITAAKDGVARILKYSVEKDLSDYKYEGIIFTNSQGNFWNLECSDTFCIGDKWYLTYSAQDDTLWYAMSDDQYGPYSEAKRLEGKLFYAAKHVEDGNNSYMVGWARRSDPVSSLNVDAWAGNLVVQKLEQKEDGELVLAPVENVVDQFKNERKLLSDSTQTVGATSDDRVYSETFKCYESFKLTGEFEYSSDGAFGLVFDYNGEEDKYKFISIMPEDNQIQLRLNGGRKVITEKDVELKAGQKYSFTYVQEGSVGVFYIDGQAALTVRVYGTSGKSIRLYAQNNEVKFTSLKQWTK